MRYKWDKKYLYWGIMAFLVILASMLCIFVVFRFDVVASIFGVIIGVLSPVLYGVVIAFLVDPVVRGLERLMRKIFKKRVEAVAGNPKKQRKQKKRWRVICILVSLFLVMTAIAGLLWLVIPQLVVSISQLVDNAESYYRNFTRWINDFMQSDSTAANAIKSFLGDGFEKVNELLEKTVLPELQKYATQVTSGLFGMVSVASNLIIGFIISIYFLYHKENFIGHIKMFLYSFLKKEWVNSLISVGRDANKYFGSYITGQIMDAAIVGVLCFTVMSIFRFDYALLISVIVAVTNVIPFFGPFIGGIPSALFLLMIDPMQAFWFVVWIVILQQVDGNIIAPMVQGNRTGLSGFWVITSIAVFGGLFGILGIIIAVPCCAIILVLLKRWMERGLKRRKMDCAVDTYLGEGIVYESDLPQNEDDDRFKEPIKSADMHRVPEAHEVRPTSKTFRWIQRRIKKAKRKHQNNQKK